MKKTITIGIPAYKAQNTIEECLSSINIQTMRDNIEVVIANDNPGVDDYSYLKKLFPKLDIVLTETEKNGGPGVARNKTIEKGTGDWIMFMDADDVLFSPYSVEQLYNATKQQNVIQAQGVFVQPVKTNDGKIVLYPQNNINHPWSFARLTNLNFLKQNKIDFGLLPNMEDGRFQWCINLLIDGTPLKRSIINDVCYVWKEGSEHSITRSGMDINGGIPVYNFSMCQIGASIAAKQAVEFALSRNPFNGNIQKFLIEQMVGHYFTYYECKEKCPIFAEQNWWLSQWFYNECFKKYCANITDELIDQFYMQMLSVKGSTLKHFPELTFKQWFDKIKKDDFIFEELQNIRNRLPQEILDVERKSGSLTQEARDNALAIFDVDNHD